MLELDRPERRQKGQGRGCTASLEEGGQQHGPERWREEEEQRKSQGIGRRERQGGLLIDSMQQTGEQFGRGVVSLTNILP